MSAVRVSAPGKVILCGEHAVVHGKTAIALSLGLRTTVSISVVEGLDEPLVHLDLPDIDIDETWAIPVLEATLLKDIVSVEGAVDGDITLTPQLRETIEKFAGYDGSSKSLAKVSFLFLYIALVLQSGCRKSLRVSVQSTLPIGAGLGSSASFGTALAAALLLVRERHRTGRSDATVPAATVNTWAFRSEQLVHGNPSGLDNTMSTLGGALSFKSGQVERLDKAPVLRFLLVNTNKERSTRLLVAKVRENLEKFPGVIAPILDAIHGISLQVLQLFQSEADDREVTRSLESLFTINHSLLNAIGVGHPALDEICRTTASFGLKSKLTGAGGGGCAITLITPDTPEDVIDQVQKALVAQGYSCCQTDVAGPGVQEHDINSGAVLCTL